MLEIGSWAPWKGSERLILIISCFSQHSISERKIKRAKFAILQFREEERIRRCLRNQQTERWQTRKSSFHARLKNETWACRVARFLNFTAKAESYFGKLFRHSAREIIFLIPRRTMLAFISRTDIERRIFLVWTFCFQGIVRKACNIFITS